MKKQLLLSGICMIGLSAHAATVSPYVEAKISENWLKAEYRQSGFGKDFTDSVAGGEIAIGAKLDSFRLELAGYYNANFKDNLLSVIPVKLKSKGLFLNGYYDIPLTDNLKKIKPYVGCGIGYSWLTGSASVVGLGKETIKDQDVAYDIGLGFAYELNSNIDLTLGYQYSILGELKKYDTKTKVKDNKLSLG